MCVYGEIYGFRPMKEELMKQGFDFQGESIGEILFLFTKNGGSMFKD